MSNALFITEEGFISPRWRQSFPRARIAVGQNDASSPSPELVWILTAIPGWTEQIRHHVAEGRRVVAMTRHPQLEELRQALNAGARGYTEALASRDILTQAAQTVTAGGLWLPASLVNKMIGLLSQLLDKQPISESCDLSTLTERERQVTAEVLKGASNKRIALELDITERTVKAHLSSIFEKLGARDRMHLMLLVRGQEHA
ncbi:response regulator transcription factor [Zobellella taiwanensis]